MNSLLLLHVDENSIEQCKVFCCPHYSQLPILFSIVTPDLGSTFFFIIFFFMNSMGSNYSSALLCLHSCCIIWTSTWLPDTSSDACQPGMRGGHQMCIDTERQIIYLMGGWDGNDDLADFWMFDINQKSWRMISRDTEQDGGPCARSCHKLCLDHKRKLIFMLGRYLDSEVRSTMSLKVCTFQKRNKRMSYLECTLYEL